ncbi:hypothetical protein [Streptomyces sp. NPDC050856]|uniref:hypothetical protein n=1 Tax=Streptomyces sp. NPDC050856 TaxID=3154939 RepID=UPI0033D8FF7E
MRTLPAPPPPKGGHIVLLGRSLFNVKSSGSGQDLRFLGVPSAVEHDEEEG